MQTETEHHTADRGGTSDTVDIEARLLADLQRATSNRDQLETDVETLLQDGDVIQEDRDAARAALEQARGALEAAIRAVDRFREGTYGLCSSCSQPIGAERLAVLPETTLCVSCRARG